MGLYYYLIDEPRKRTLCLFRLEHHPGYADTRELSVRIASTMNGE